MKSKTAHMDYEKIENKTQEQRLLTYHNRLMTLKKNADVKETEETDHDKR